MGDEARERFICTPNYMFDHSAIVPVTIVTVVFLFVALALCLWLEALVYRSARAQANRCRLRNTRTEILRCWRQGCDSEYLFDLASD